MAQKTEIQYVGQFYVYGSEAKKVESVPRWVLPKLPRIKLEKFQKIYIDPVAVCCICVAVFMLTVLALGSVQFQGSRAAYDQINSQLTALKRENATLSHVYHTSYDLEDIRVQAEKIGMLEMDEAEGFTISFSVPKAKEKPTAWDNLVWFMSGLFENVRR